MRPRSARCPLRPRAFGGALPLALAALALAGLGLGCSDDGRDAPPEAAADLALPEETEAQLQALGYGAWSEPGEAGDLARSGVTVHDRERAAPGLNLFKQTGKREALLMDLDGRIVHRWGGPGSAGRAMAATHREREASDEAVRRHFKRRKAHAQRSWHWVRVLPGGDLVGVVKRLWIERLDWDSNVRWITPLAAHHDLDFDAEGRILTLTERIVELRLASGRRVPILDNEIAVVDAGDGRVLERISLAPFFGALVTDAELRTHMDDDDDDDDDDEHEPLDVFHANTIEVVRRDVPGVARAGQVLLSVRNLDLVAVVDLAERRVVWQWGPGVLSEQHHPTFLENGNLLVFDNRPEEGASRVVEVDPRRREIVWEYRGDPPARFFTRTRGSAYPMANGNVLVAESNRGHAFEVTRAGDVVWEYWHTALDPSAERRGTFYRFARLAPGYLEPGLLSDSEGEAGDVGGAGETGMAGGGE